MDVFNDSFVLVKSIGEYEALSSVTMGHPKREAFVRYYTRIKQLGVWLTESYFVYDISKRALTTFGLIKEFEQRGGQLTLHEASMLHHIEYPGTCVFMSHDEIEAIIRHFSAFGAIKTKLPEKVSRHTIDFLKRFVCKDVSIYHYKIIFYFCDPYFTIF